MDRLFSLLAAGLRLAVLAVLACAPCGASPYLPANGSQVVEHLPVRTSPAQRELARLRAELARHPTDIDRAAALARRYIEQARIEGDPRYLGYAEAALGPWYALAQPPTQVLVLRATLRQSAHRFAPALADLDAVLRRDSDNAQAWLTRATVQLVTGDFSGARASCMRLHSRAPALVVQACLSNVDSVNGRAESAYTMLESTLARHPGNAPGVRQWTLTLLAEMAARAGNAIAAQAHYQQAFAQGEADSYLLGAYADFLIDQRRYTQVIDLLKNRTRVDALLLRYAIALRAVAAPGAAAQTAALRARFDAAMLRGDTVHLREQARFELVLMNDPHAAVRLAKLNWPVQKEPADLRILAEAAAASGDREAARTALAWAAASRIEDRALAAPLARLKGNR
jgi:Tfp pilus assembly protein PilF